MLQLRHQTRCPQLPQRRPVCNSPGSGAGQLRGRRAHATGRGGGRKASANKVSPLCALPRRRRRRAKEYSRRKMAEHRAWQADISTKIKLRDAALAALPADLRAAALVPDLTPFPTNRCVSRWQQPVAGQASEFSALLLADCSACSAPVGMGGRGGRRLLLPGPRNFPCSRECGRPQIAHGHVLGRRAAGSGVLKDLYICLPLACPLPPGQSGLRRHRWRALARARRGSRQRGGNQSAPRSGDSRARDSACTQPATLQQ